MVTVIVTLELNFGAGWEEIYGPCHVDEFRDEARETARDVVADHFETVLTSPVAVRRIN